ncbi:MAG TPA: hypothetical protein VHB79_32525 [Polyangiaceae bacterium]|nr:hypothetical protein [Polyangiaceae bacterium]
MKAAALDLGSNSFHLLVADIGRSGELEAIDSRKAVLRLGTVVQEQGRLSDQAFADALTAVGQLAAFAKQAGAEKLTTVGTSALRDARNGHAFCEACSTRWGVEVELLSGDEEARLAYVGARSGLRLPGGRTLVADLGGGSLELAVGDGPSCDGASSLPLGFLRLARAFNVADVAGTARLSRYVQLECEKARWQLGRFDTLLLSGGTARALGKLLGGGIASISSTQVIDLCDTLALMDCNALLERGVGRNRALTLATGAAVMSGVVAGFGRRELRISPRGLREGVLLRDLARPPLRVPSPTASW